MLASTEKSMANVGSVVFAGIAPHPPIMVPEVGRDAIVDVRSSIDAMAELTSRVIRSGAETVILISPHAPLEQHAFVAYEGSELYGDFAKFRAPTTAVSAPLDEELLEQIAQTSTEQHLGMARISGLDLDHGATVPLYFLQRNGWHGRLIALGYSFLSNEDHVRFGNCIRQAVNKVGRPVAFIASGDLSHRLNPEAPAGYDTQAHLFDEEVVDAIQNCLTDRIVSVDQELRRKAGECGYRSMLVAIGVAEGGDARCEVISYEAPFGVGYMVAQLLMSEPVAGHRESMGQELPDLARETVETFVTKGEVISAPMDRSDLLSQRAACFVSIKTREGDLRGCIGTFEPAKNTLAEELIANAISAATRDPRFPPIAARELPELKYSVDVLSPPEPAAIADLDPQTYGVIVEDEEGRRGLLLPNLKGIDSVTRQVDIALRKAGISPGAEIRIWRFRAERYKEKEKEKG